MSKNLVIVESPAKAKTIEKFLGEEYHVLPSQGHIRDIEGIGKKAIGIDFENGYQPNYVIDPQKVKLIENLRKEAEKADTIWLASDEDREGEAIAWHLQQVLELPLEKTRRIVFPEITKQAILQAIKEPRGIDYNLVNAQQARRVLDRIVGFELSPILWRKVTTGLSAGRVQSVAVRLIVEKEREIENFKESTQYRVVADFIGQKEDGEKVVFKAELSHRFVTESEAVAFLNDLDKRSFRVAEIQSKPIRRSPAPPFTTSSLQQEAARKLKYPVSKTMRLAQSMYEAGLITYMRTDSVNLSTLALGTCKEEILAEFGTKYHKSRQFKTVSKGAQEAHEAIRPTYMSNRVSGKSTDEKRLYELIWKRTLASQMADAELEAVHVEITADGCPYTFVASGETMLFDGFTRVYIQSSDDERNEKHEALPMLQANTDIQFAEVTAQETHTRPPFRYSEASLINKMEELGIGRPSTYSTIVETIQARKYVERATVPGRKREYTLWTMKNHKLTERHRQETYGQDNNKLLPTDLGRITNDFLVDQFPEILSYDFTAREEENFDKIAMGKADWQKTVDAFYHTFHPAITAVPAGKVAGRLLGTHPQTGAPVFAKISKVGPCVQIGDADHGKPKFVTLPKEYSLFTITLSEALQLFEDAQPAVLCQYEGQDVVLGEGKYGPYIKCGDMFVSVPRNMNPHELTEEDVNRLIENQKNLKNPLRTLGNIQVFKGRYGLYLKTDEGNYRLPKTTQVEDLTLEECQQIIDNQNQKNHARRNS